MLSATDGTVTTVVGVGHGQFKYNLAGPCGITRITTPPMVKANRQTLPV